MKTIAMYWKLSNLRKQSYQKYIDCNKSRKEIGKKDYVNFFSV